MPRLFLAPAREQVDPKIDCRRNTDSPRANGSKPEVRQGDLVDLAEYLDERIAAARKELTAMTGRRRSRSGRCVSRVTATPLTRCVNHLVHLQREALVFDVTC